MILNYINEMIPFTLAALIVLAAVRIIRHRKAGTSLSEIAWLREAGIAFFAAVLAALIAKTVLQGILIMDGRLRFLYKFSGNINLLPFIALKTDNAGGLIDIIGNTAMFIPIGLLLPLLWEPFRRWRAAVVFCFLLSLFIESVQLFLPRTTDINDLLLNTAGAAIGYLIYFLADRLYKKRKIRAD